MTNPCDDRTPTQKPRQRAETSLPPPEDSDRSAPLPGSLEEFILDRFSTKLENPETGRRVP